MPIGTRTEKSWVVGEDGLGMVDVHMSTAAMRVALTRAQRMPAGGQSPQSDSDDGAVAQLIDDGS